MTLLPWGLGNFLTPGSLESGPSARARPGEDGSGTHRPPAKSQAPSALASCPGECLSEQRPQLSTLTRATSSATHASPTYLQRRFPEPPRSRGSAGHRSCWWCECEHQGC
ncbi:unnamed protein product [Eretmochelys imbricata]